MEAGGGGNLGLRVVGTQGKAAGCGAKPQGTWKELELQVDALGTPCLSLCICPWCRNRQCRLVQEGKDCVQGLRLRHHYMLCGALLRVWGRIAAVIADVTSSSYLQIVRLKTKDKKKQVGEWVGRHGSSGWECRGECRIPGPDPQSPHVPQASRSPRPVCTVCCRSCSSWMQM